MVLVAMVVVVLLLVIALHFILRTLYKRPDTKQPLHVAFIHPDLGIGGAERLIIDAAISLKKRGHDIDVFTGWCELDNPKRTYPETRSGELKIHVIGAWMPRKILGRGYALCAYLRNFYVAFGLIKHHYTRQKFDIIFSDQVSASIPLFKIFLPKVRVAFYCHYPDLLLSKPGSTLKRVYRLVLDTIEEVTTGLSDVIMVNSDYTQSIFTQTFPLLRRFNITPLFLKPAINLDQYTIPPTFNLEDLQSYHYFLSFNRFEIKKNHLLAVKAFNNVVKSLPKEHTIDLKLVIAGGYGENVVENVQTAEQIQQLVRKLDLSDRVTLLKSVDNDVRNQLLAYSLCLVYTPEFEHFGITPVESMYLKRPVVACNNGGPKESILHRRTGILCSARPEEGLEDKYVTEFTEAMKELALDKSNTRSMGQHGRDRVRELFSLDSFGDKLQGIILNTFN